MSDENSPWLQVLRKLQKKILSMKTKSKVPIKKHVLQPVSAFLWVMMILWAEICCLVLFIFLLVSF